MERREARKARTTQRKQARRIKNGQNNAVQDWAQSYTETIRQMNYKRQHAVLFDRNQFTFHEDAA